MIKNLQSILLIVLLKIFKDTSMTELCKKSRILTGYLELLLEENLSEEEEKIDDSDPSPKKKRKSGEEFTVPFLILYQIVGYLFLWGQRYFIIIMLIHILFSRFCENSYFKESQWERMSALFDIFKICYCNRWIY